MEKVRTIRDFPRPRTVKQVQKFLGLINYYKQYFPNMTEMTANIRHLLKKEARFWWDDVGEREFQDLKQVLSERTLLYLPDLNKQFILTCHASTVGVGAVLSQMVAGQEQ